ncbi:SigB/SigF/SigG family RNA polymerase sigma factor [Polymorphospora sp. NPDC051019]|uniref:SigB/SigF/SigG family RNA polymerase sigma factor n=1 Tax=unclassified Polymorphospora TaxID=2685497 RepID=UPI0033E3FFA6
MVPTSVATVPTDPGMLDELAESYAARVTGLAPDAAERCRLRERLVHAALPLAARLARRYQGRGEPLEDLEQVARLGLLKAVDRYDPGRGAFTGFAAITMAGELRRHFRDRTWGVHVPRRMQERSMEVSRVTAELTTELHRAPTTAELADRMGTGTEDIRTAQETSAAYSAMSLNAPAHADATGELADQLGDADGNLDSVDDRLTVSALLCRLPARERRILALRFYGNHTQAEIAAELGISQMHVSRLLSRALAWLREAMFSDAPLRWQAGVVPTDARDLSVRIRLTGAVAVVAVAGEVDRDNAGLLRDRLLEAVRRGVPEVAVDLGGVPFIDAAGISAILVGFEAGRGAGVRLRITAPRPQVLRTLQAAGLQPLLESSPKSAG